MSEISVLDTSPGFKRLVNNWLEVIDLSVSGEDSSKQRELITLRAAEITSHYSGDFRDVMTRYLIRGSFAIAKDIRVASNSLTTEDFDE